LRLVLRVLLILLLLLIVAAYVVATRRVSSTGVLMSASPSAPALALALALVHVAHAVVSFVMRDFCVVWIVW
jgi:hypothetical protein